MDDFDNANQQSCGRQEQAASGSRFELSVLAPVFVGRSANALCHGSLSTLCSGGGFWNPNARADSCTDRKNVQKREDTVESSCDNTHEGPTTRHVGPS